jgi:hypothetical protein
VTTPLLYDRQVICCIKSRKWCPKILTEMCLLFSQSCLLCAHQTLASFCLPVPNERVQMISHPFQPFSAVISCNATFHRWPFLAHWPFFRSGWLIHSINSDHLRQNQLWASAVCAPGRRGMTPLISFHIARLHQNICVRPDPDWVYHTGITVILL